MARPAKEGLDYFPHDTDAVNDEKIETMIALYGNDGYAFYFIMLERIYRSKEQEISFNTISAAETMQIYSRKVSVTEQKFAEMLKTALKIGLFDKTKYEELGILTSNGIKKRSLPILEKRNRMKDLYKEKLVSAGVSAAETGAESTQSKVKERKGKENKEKNNSLVNIVDDQVSKIPYSNIFTLWNENCKPEFQALEKLNDTRKKKIKIMWMRYPDIEKWKLVIQKMKQSTFLTGKTGNFTASFDFIISNNKQGLENFSRILEGVFETKGKPGITTVSIHENYDDLGI